MSRPYRAPGIALLLLVSQLWIVAPAYSGDWEGESGGNDVTVIYTDSDGNETTNPGSGSGGSTTQWQYRRAHACFTAAGELTGGTCDIELANVLGCPPGSQVVLPLWRRQQLANGAWSMWELVEWYSCPGATTTEQAAINAWASMSIEPHTIFIQPNQGWVIATVPTIVYVDRDPRTLTANIGGTSVIIRATPINYRWQWGDGSPATNTSHPGAPYPDHTVTHTYVHIEQDVTIRLTTTWRGSFSLDGGSTWLPAPGAASTASTPITVYVHNPHSHSVGCDLDGGCYVN